MEKPATIITLQNVLLWERADCLRGVNPQMWKDMDDTSPAPTYEELADGSLQFYNGDNGRPCRILCEFEKDLLKEFWLQTIMTMRIPDAQFQIPPFKDLEIWRQKLNDPGLNAWEAFVNARQTPAQKEEREDSIKDWKKLMHDMFWHKERHCRCKAKRKGRRALPAEPFEDVVKSMILGPRWKILKSKYGTLVKNEPIDEALIMVPESEQQENQDASAKGQSTSTGNTFENNATAGISSKKRKTPMKVNDNEILAKRLKMVEESIKWPKNMDELLEFVNEGMDEPGAKAELYKEILDQGHGQKLKDVNAMEHTFDFQPEDDIAVEPTSTWLRKPRKPRTPRRRRKQASSTPKKEAETSKADAEAAKDDFVKNTSRKKINIHLTIKKHDDGQMEEQGNGEMMDALVKKPRSRKRKTLQEAAEALSENAERDEEMMEAQVKKPRARAPKTPKKALSNSDKAAEAQNVTAENLEENVAKNNTPAFDQHDDQQMKDAPVYTSKAPAEETLKKTSSILKCGETAEAPEVSAKTSITTVADKNDTPSKQLDLASMALEQPENEDMKDTPVKKPQVGARKRSTKKVAPPKSTEAAETSSTSATDDTPSKLLTLATVKIGDQGDEQIMGAPVKTPNTPVKRRSRAKKPATTLKQADTVETPETPHMVTEAPNKAATDDTPSKELKLGSMKIEDQEDEEMLEAPAMAPNTPAKRKPSTKKIAVTATPKKRKTPLKNDVAENKPTKKGKAAEKDVIKVEKSKNIIRS